jgi:glycosyltransferase involved in cell wall biosynthesis
LGRLGRLGAGVNVTDLRAELAGQCVERIEQFVAAQAPGWRLPRVFAGHAVGADVRADLMFTLGHLASAGVDRVAATPVEDAIALLLRGVDGAATHSFFSYRIAETLLDAGPFAGNPRLVRCSAAERDEVAAACDSSSFLPLLADGRLPRNYAAVLARCEQARLQLGLVDDPRTFDELVAQLRELLDANPRHHLDDSNDGSGRYDIYTADVWLFCEPLAAAIGPAWRAGFGDAIALVERTIGRDSSAIPWGRSTGVLAIALTVELAAAALTHTIGDGAPSWLRRGGDAATALRAWFGPDGVVRAHQHRDQDRYRGPARRLQLTFDVLGKLAWSARALGSVSAEVDAATGPVAYAPLDELLRFDDRTTAAVWTYRTPALSFVLPLVGAARSHYLPALYRPGSFEVPVDQDLPCWTPLVVDGYQRYTAGGLPATVAHGAGELSAAWNGFVATVDTFATEPPEPLAGTRHAHWRVDGRGVVLDDTLQFERAPGAIAYAIPEVASRPLLVEFECDAPHTASIIDVDGIAEWRSSWSVISRVHQLDVDPAADVRVTVRVTPKLRVASSAFGHHYHRSLYEPLGDRVVTWASPFRELGDAHMTALDQVDVFHLHWPEWLTFGDVDEHERIAALLADCEIPVVWTAHNLTPHAKQPDRFDRVYALWASRASAVIHHSEWGRQRMVARYDFAAQAEHVVLPHGHFGGLWADVVESVDRAAAEEQLGFPPCAIRIGLVGAPRVDKRTRSFVDGFVASARDDVQLAVWSLGWGETLPEDPRIVASERYRLVDVETYATRLAACDVLALPFDPAGEMLATGTVADAIGVGIPVLGSDWGFLIEYLGDARLGLGAATPAEVTAAIDALSSEQVEAARAATVALRDRFEWGPIADATHALFERAVQSMRRQ